MPAWWKGRWKGKAKANSKSAAASETSLRSRPEWIEEVVEGERSWTPKHLRESKNERANSFDGVLVGRKVPVISAGDVGGESGSVFAFDHPLPHPSVSAPLPSTPLTKPAMAAAHGSASTSTICSSRSSNDIPELGFYRLWNPIEVAKGRHVSPDSRRDQYVMEDKRRFSCSPVLENLWIHDFPAYRGREIHLKGISATENATIHYPARKQDDLRSPPHPLPLPPNSPTSPSFSTCSSQTQWKKGKLLGRGSFGHVYLGFSSESGQMCAIKEVTLISDDSISRESFKQLNQEINLLSKLSHPNIVQYYGSELVDETLEVYLEYVSGGSIHKLLQEYGPFEEPVLRNYTAQIVSGLAYLHGRNTVHRDIKGANILVDPNGQVKLADFGMAKHISSYTSLRSFKGSPYWMAPEVIMNGSGYNLSVDIWSLGCTVLEMATCKPPWSQFEGVAAIFKIGNSKEIPDIPDHLTSEARSFLKLCLQRDPSARPTANQLIDHPFVRDQAAIKAAKSSVMKDMVSSSSDGSNSTVKGFHINTSVSASRDMDYGLQRRLTDPLPHKKSSDLVGVRMNKSLPVSPCSSPLRQFKQRNLSCFPSPTHPIYSPGALTYELRNCSACQMRPNH